MGCVRQQKKRVERPKCVLGGGGGERGELETRAAPDDRGVKSVGSGEEESQRTSRKVAQVETSPVN